ncbi:MAG: hypothetical protein H0X73_12985 [Chthoniobacterales bacterium]|nr:hypothetical protein [Chthoniobacterales bacterium]
MAVFAFGFAAIPRSEAGVSVGIGIGVPVGFGYGYAPAPVCYPAYAYAPYGYAPYYRRPAVNVYLRPHYHWRHHRRIHCTARHR